MRLLALILVALVSVSPTGEAAPTASPLHVRIDNEVAAVDARIDVYDEDDALVATRSVRVAPGLNVVEISIEPALYYLRLAVEGDDRQAVFNAVFGEGGVMQGAHNVGCPGPYAVDFTISARGVGTQGAGCLVLDAAASALIEEARAAKVGASFASFSVPAPGSADRGVFGKTLFEWRGDAPFLDAWGRPAFGPELRYVANGFVHYSSEDAITGIGASAEVSKTVETFRYLPGDVMPHLRTATDAGFGTGETPTSTSVTVQRELRYDEPLGMFACAVRNGLQGRTLRPGDEIASVDICPEWTGPAWRAAAPVTIEGYRLLPLYQLDESAERIVVGRVYLIDDLPSPFSMERHVLPAGGTLRSAGGVMQRYQAGGDPIPLDGQADPSPRVALTPLDPLRGPALGNAGARVPFPLADAANAALADPTLRDLHAVVARPDAALVGAVYGIARDDGSPIALQRWGLLYSASGTLPVAVVCERPESPSPLPIPPPARCRQQLGGDGVLQPIYDAPSMGRDELPRESATFAHALARWDLTRDGGIDGEPITYALYRAWKYGDAPHLAVGTAVPMPLTPADPEVAGSSDHVALELATGRTLVSVRLEQVGESLGDAPLGTVGPSSLRVEEAPFLDSDNLPLIVGSGIGLALLALLGFILYSRLVRARVLDSATRAAILDVVTAEPGLHASGIMEALGKRGGVTEYHLDVLVREGFLTSLATPGFRRYFATGTRAPQEMRAIAAMREGQNDKLMRIIRANPGIPLQTLALEAGMSVPYASRSIARLAEAGLVEKVQVGRAVTLHADES